MRKPNRGENSTEYKGLYYGENQNGVFVVLPPGIKDINSPDSFHIVPTNCEMSAEEKDKKAREHIDFVTTLEEGYEHIAGNTMHETPSNESTSPSWWVKLENGTVFIAEIRLSTDGKTYLRPKVQDWKTASEKQIKKIQQLPLMKCL